MVFVYITCKNRKEARKIGEVLVKEKLVACVNYFPIESIYFWDGKMTDDKEFVLLAKTVKKNFSKLEERVKELHSYEVPCIVALPIAKINKKYGDWAKRQTKI
jgi:periplasmic divalent cation tolerance protein